MVGMKLLVRAVDATSVHLAVWLYIVIYISKFPVCAKQVAADMGMAV